MLTIRFSRIGKRKQPFYRLIVSEKTKDTAGNYLELLGHYDPRTKVATIKRDRVEHWMKFGATASSSVFNLFLKEGVITGGRKQRVVHISKKRAAAKAEEQKAAEAKVAEAKPVPEPAATEISGGEAPSA